MSKSESNKNGLMILIDPYIHKQAKLTREQFLERVKSVQKIRTDINHTYTSFYISTLKEYNNLIKLHELINKGIFDFADKKVFLIAIPPNLYEWFKSTPIIKIQKQIVCWLASQYHFDINKRVALKNQIYLPLFEEMTSLIEIYYDASEVKVFNVTDKESFIESFDEQVEYEENCTLKYISVCNKFYGSNPPQLFNNPFVIENQFEWGVNIHLDFEFLYAYFSDEDWKYIVLEGNEDKLLKSSNREDLWIKWKHIYSTFDQRKNFLYNFYFEKI